MKHAYTRRLRTCTKFFARCTIKWPIFTIAKYVVSDIFVVRSSESTRKVRASICKACVHLYKYKWVFSLLMTIVQIYIVQAALIRWFISICIYIVLILSKLSYLCCSYLPCWYVFSLLRLNPADSHNAKVLTNEKATSFAYYGRPSIEESTLIQTEYVYM